MLARRQTPIDGIIDLHVDENELVERMVARGRSDDKPEVIRERMATYHRQTTPLTDYYAERRLLESVEAMGTVEEVFSRLLEAVGRLAARRGSRAWCFRIRSIGSAIDEQSVRFCPAGAPANDASVSAREAGSDQSRGKFNEVHQPAKPARTGPDAEGGIGGLAARIKWPSRWCARA